MNNTFYVTVKEDGIQPWMKKLGVQPNERYRVLGIMSEMILILVGQNLVEIYPRHVLYAGELG